MYVRWWFWLVGYYKCVGKLIICVRKSFCETGISGADVSAAALQPSAAALGATEALGREASAAALAHGAAALGYCSRKLFFFNEFQWW